jgi:cytochrome c oxidase subunit III
MGFKASRSSRLDGCVTERRTQLGMAMFLIAEAVFFFLLILAFIYFRSPAEQDLHLQTTSLYTGLLLASGFSMWRAAASTAGSRLWVVITIGLGAAFLLGQGSEYLRLIRDGVTMSQSLFGTTFLTLVGVHALHLVVGLVALAIIPLTAIRTMALYWYFFAGVWLAIFLVAYVGSAA